jgi:hypothetical protein
MELTNNLHGRTLLLASCEPDSTETQPTGITAAEMGRKGGSSRTLAKRLAAKVNGKLGGRPKKQAHTPAPQKCVSYAEIAINGKMWGTFSPERLEQYKDDVFRYYRQAGLPFKFSKEEIQDDYRMLVNFDYRKKVSGDIIGQVLHGQSLCWSFHPHAWSVQCGRMLTPVEAFRDDALFRKVIAKCIADGRNMSDAAMRRTLKTYSGVQAVSNFRPLAAAALYDLLLPAEGGHVYDPSAGWGGRLLGALICDKVKSYMATDPSIATWYGNNQLANEYNKRGIPVQLVNSGSENFRPDQNSKDLILSSPPYFNCERYSDESTQSCNKFSTPDAWLNGFMKPTLENCHHCLKQTGLMAINIANVKKTYPTLEQDFAALATACGFRLLRTMQLALSSMRGTRKPGEKCKYEPVFVFEKA